MTLSFFGEIAVAVACLVIPAATVSLLAYLSTNRRAPQLFVYSVLALTCFAAMVVVIAVRLQPYHVDRPLWRDILGAVVSWAPVFLVPSGLLMACVTGSISRRWIPVIATLGVVIAWPIAVILGYLAQ